MKALPIGAVLGLGLGLGLLAIPTWTWAADQPVILGYAEFPPFTYTDSEGRPQGSLIEMVRTVAADAGLNLEVRGFPAANLYRAIADGHVHVFMGVTTAPEFQGTTIAGPSVIARIELDIYAMDDTPLVRHMEDLTGRTVIIHSGYSYAGWRTFLEDPAHHVTLIVVESAERGLSMLRSQPNTMLLEYTLPMKLALAGRTPPNLKAMPISGVEAHFVVSKQAPDAAGTLARLEQSFQRLRNTGTLP
jgi:polar amino acid transport system substrate-binding protein